MTKREDRPPSKCHPEKPNEAFGLCAACYTRQRRTGSTKPREKTKPENARAGHLRRKYGMTMEQFATLLEAQSGVCAICGKPPKEGRNLNIDHDHRSGLVRGLLCWGCNWGLLGHGREDPEKHRRAADYLEAPPAPLAIGELITPKRPHKRRTPKPVSITIEDD